MNDFNALWREKASRRGLKWSRPILLSAVLIISGFFIFSPVLAVHTTTVSYTIDDVDVDYIKGNANKPYQFGIVNNGSDSVNYIKITAPSGFTITGGTMSENLGEEWTYSESSSYILCQVDFRSAQVLGAGEGAEISFSAKSSNLEDDTVSTWSVLTYDTAYDNYQDESLLAITVDVTSPETEALSVPTGWQDGDVTVTLDPTDNFEPEVTGSGIATTYHCTYNDSNDPCTQMTEGISVNVTCPDNSVCQKIVRYYSVDNVGNEEIYKDTAVIQIDKQKPATDITIGEHKYYDEPGDVYYVKSTTEFTLSANDGSGSGIATTTYQIDSEATEEYSSPFTVAEAGSHILTYGSVDQVGNEKVNTLNIYVDDTEPAIGEITIEPSYNDGATNYVSGTSNISALVNDGTSSGVKTCYYILDGGSDWTEADYNSETNVCGITGANTSGATSINIKAVDNVGNENNNVGNEIPVTPDTISPETSDSGTGTDWYSGNVTVTLESTDVGSGVASMKYCIDSNNTCVPDIAYNTETKIVVEPEGENYVRYYSLDNVGNMESTKPAAHSVKIDKSTPAIGPVEVIYPADQTKAKDGDTITVSAVISDTYSGVETVTLDATNIGGSASVPMTDGGSGTYTADVIISGTSGDGPRTLTVTAADGVGNSDSSEGSVDIDNTLPDINSYFLNDQEADAYFNPGLVNITINATEPVEWVSARIYQVGNESTYKDEQPSEGNGTATTNFNWNGSLTAGGTGPIDGIYQIKVHITDLAGNDVTSLVLSPDTIIVDTVNPVVSISNPTEDEIIRDADGKASVNFSATDDNELSCFYQIDGSDEALIGSCNSPVSIPVPDGRYMITLIARDPAGNEGSDSVNILMDSDNNFRVDDTPANNPDFATIQEAIADAQDNYTISVAGGDYTLSSTLNLNLTGLKIVGDSQSEVAINASGVSGYGIAPSANDIVLEKFTLTGPVANAGSSYGIKASHISNFTMKDITVQGSGRSEFDLNTVNGGLLENVTANGQNTAGVGIALSHSDSVILRNVTTLGNTWGGVGLFDTAEGATSNITFDETNSFGEPNPVYIDTENSFPATNIKLPGFSHAVRNTLNPRYTSFQQSEEKAIAVALAPGTPVNASSYIQTLDTEVGGYVALKNNFIVGNGMSIQSAIDAALPSATINVATGTYEEGIVIINQDLTIVGDGSNKPIIKPNEDTGTANAIGATGRGWFQITKATVSFENLIFNGTGKLIYTAVHYHEDSTGGTVKNCDFMNIAHTPSGYQGRGINNYGQYVKVLNCTFNNIYRIGVFTYNPTAETLIQDCVYTGKGVGDYLDYGFEAGNDATITVKNSTITNCKGVASVDDSTSAGILVTTYYGDGTTATIQDDNKLYNNTEGIGIGYDESDSSTVIVNGNEIHDNGKGIGTSESSSISLIVNENKIYSNSEYGIDAINGPSVDAKYNWWGTAAEDEIQEMISVNVDYDCWYLKSDMKDNSCNINLNNIYIDDSYINPLACESAGYYYGFNCFETIQGGIDMVTENGLVEVGPGVYEEIITINNPLTLRGATYDDNKNGYVVPTDYVWDDSVESIIQTSGDETIVKITADDVTLEGFVIQALNRSGSGDRHLVEIQADSHGKDLENIDIINNVIGPNTNTADQDGSKGRMNLYIALNQYQETPWGMINSLISGNKIFGSEGNGNAIFIWGAYYAYGARNPSPMTETVIEDNEISKGHRTGIEIAGGISGLTIRNNDIHDFSGLPEDDQDDLKYGHGIVLIRGSSDSGEQIGLGPEDLIIEVNKIYNNEKSAIYTGPVSKDYIIVGNEIYNNGWDGIRLDMEAHFKNPDFEEGDRIGFFDHCENISVNENKIYNNGGYGIKVIGTPTDFEVAAEFNWWNTTTGPNHESNLGGLGDGVSNNVDFRPWCVGWDAEEGCIIDNTPPPSVVSGSQTPPDGAIGVSLSPTVSLEFNELVQCGAGEWTECFSIDSADGTFDYFDYSDNTLTFTPTGDLTYNTEYAVSLISLGKIIDQAGNLLDLGEIDSWSFITLTHYSIPLEVGISGVGWNLISIPTLPSQGTEISAVLGTAKSNIDSVWQYDYDVESNEYKWYVYHSDPQVPSNLSNLTTMEPGYGYWIKATASTTITGEGSLFGAQNEQPDGTPQQAPPSRNLVSGWNLIGYYQRAGNDNAPVSCALSSLADKWNNLFTYINGYPVSLESNTIINPGKAFWASLKSDAVYTPGNKYTQ